jgi:hypothetical protein
MIDWNEFDEQQLRFECIVQAISDNKHVLGVDPKQIQAARMFLAGVRALRDMQAVQAAKPEQWQHEVRRAKTEVEIAEARRHERADVINQRIENLEASQARLAERLDAFDRFVEKDYRVNMRLENAAIDSLEVKLAKAVSSLEVRLAKLELGAKPK